MPLLTGLTGRPPAYRAYRAYGAYRRYRALPKIFPPAAQQTLYEVSGALWPMLLLALASIFSLADAQHFNFVEFAGNGQVSGVLYATGFTIEVLEHVWEKYSPALISAAATDPAFDAGFKTLRRSPPELEYEVALSFYAGLRYIHQYPTAEGLRDVHYGRSKRALPKTAFYNKRCQGDAQACCGTGRGQVRG